jgi:MFS family permease
MSFAVTFKHLRTIWKRHCDGGLCAFGCETMPDNLMIFRPRRRRGIWRNAPFLQLWIGQSISLLGSRITMLALPLTAILSLHASPIEFGLLGAAGSAGGLLAGLPAGLWADRARRRPIMIAASLGQALILITVPLAAALGILSLPQLVLVALLTSSLAVLFRVAYRAFLPSVVEQDQLVAANSALAASSSVAQLAGPGFGGLLVQILSAPVAIAADAISFILASIGLLVMQIEETVTDRVAGASIRTEIISGLRALTGSPLLRSLAGASAIFEFFDSVLFAVYLLYLSRDLHLSAATIGLVFGLAGAGGLLGALAVAPLTGRIGPGRAMIAGILLAASGELAISGAAGPTGLIVLVLLLAEGAVELGAALYTINAGSLQQAITPEFLRGRVGAGADLLTSSVAPLGYLLGGLLGELIGLRGTVLAAGLGTFLSLAWIVFSPVRTVSTTSPLAPI